MTVGADVCVVGSANLDLVVQVERMPGHGETLLGDGCFETAGGKGLNQAIAAARLGAEVAFVGVVGRDAAGAALRAALATEGIDVSTMLVSDGQPTGRAFITVAEDGENSIVVLPGANRELRAAVVQERAAAVVQSRVVLVQMEIPGDAVVRALQLARTAGAVTVLNPAPAVHVPAEALLAADIVVPNEHEVARLGGATALLDAGAHVVVVTEGKRGAEVITREHRHRVPPFLVNPVDTVAAGDAFCGALAARLAAGDDVDAALRWAAAAGALATTVHGAVPSLPRYGDVAALVSGTR